MKNHLKNQNKINLSIISLIIFFLFSSCLKKEKNNFESENYTEMQKLSLLGFENESKKWKLNCSNAKLNENTKIINCIDTELLIYKNKKKSALIKGKNGFLNILTQKAHIEENVSVFSYERQTNLYTSVIDYNAEKGIIYSNEDVKVVNKDAQTNAKGFEALIDLSKIKFYKHETKKL